MPAFNKDDYIDVQERINRFWQEHPDGAIRTRFEGDIRDFKQARYFAAIFKDRNNTEPDATGWAFEIAGSGGANNTSHEENCETSAIGRAFANMGYAVSRKDRPSRQEMEKVERHEAMQLPPRDRSTSVGTIPAKPETGAQDPWSLFWTDARGVGLNTWEAITRELGLNRGQFRNGDEALAGLREAIRTKMAVAV